MIIQSFAIILATTKNVTVKCDNGFQQVKATLPPKERRGLVLIDPPYELKEDYDLVVKAIEEGYKRLPLVPMRFGILLYYANKLNVFLRD